MSIFDPENASSRSLHNPTLRMQVVTELTALRSQEVGRSIPFHVSFVLLRSVLRPTSLQITEVFRKFRSHEC
jgi:hypothetical protein